MMPSVLLTTLGLDGVLRPVHLEREYDGGEKYIKSLSNMHLLSLLTGKTTLARGCRRYELTFDSADQKTALIRQVVNHLERAKQTGELRSPHH